MWNPAARGPRASGSWRRRDSGRGQGAGIGRVPAAFAQEGRVSRLRLWATAGALVLVAGASSWLLAGPGPSPATTALAREELVRGDECFRGRCPHDLLRAEACHPRATELDPALADAWGGLAMTYAVMAEYPLRDRFELYHQARRAAETGLDLDPDTSPAHVGMAMVRLVMDWDRNEARRHIALAMERGSGISRAWEVRGWIESADGARESDGTGSHRSLLRSA